jgi:hypothetical protein
VTHSACPELQAAFVVVLRRSLGNEYELEVGGQIGPASVKRIVDGREIPAVR